MQAFRQGSMQVDEVSKCLQLGLYHFEKNRHKWSFAWRYFIVRLVEILGGFITHPLARLRRAGSLPLFKKEGVEENAGISTRLNASGRSE